MKKNICIILALTAFIALFSGCSKGEKDKVSTTDLYTEGLELISEMAAISKTSIPKQLFQLNDNQISVLKKTAAGDYSSPISVYEITVSKDTIGSVADLKDFDTLPENAQNYIINKTASSLANVVNAQKGSEHIVVASSCSLYKTFVFDELEKSTLYLYIFENGTPVMISFEPGKDNSVYAHGTFAFNDGFADVEESTVDLYFSYLHADAVKIK